MNSSACSALMKPWVAQPCSMERMRCNSCLQQWQQGEGRRGGRVGITVRRGCPGALCARLQLVLCPWSPDKARLCKPACMGCGLLLAAGAKGSPT